MSGFKVGDKVALVPTTGAVRVVTIERETPTTWVSTGGVFFKEDLHRKGGGHMARRDKIRDLKEGEEAKFLERDAMDTAAGKERRRLRAERQASSVLGWVVAMGEVALEKDAHELHNAACVLVYEIESSEARLSSAADSLRTMGDRLHDELSSKGRFAFSSGIVEMASEELGKRRFAKDQADILIKVAAESLGVDVEMFRPKPLRPCPKQLDQLELALESGRCAGDFSELKRKGMVDHGGNVTRAGEWWLCHLRSDQ